METATLWKSLWESEAGMQPKVLARVLLAFALFSNSLKRNRDGGSAENPRKFGVSREAPGFSTTAPARGTNLRNGESSVKLETELAA
jgi:hypothetical protein